MSLPIRKADQRPPSAYPGLYNRSNILVDQRHPRPLMQAPAGLKVVSSSICVPILDRSMSITKTSSQNINHTGGPRKGPKKRMTTEKTALAQTEKTQEKQASYIATVSSAPGAAAAQQRPRPATILLPVQRLPPTTLAPAALAPVLQQHSQGQQQQQQPQQHQQHHQQQQQQQLPITIRPRDVCFVLDLDGTIYSERVHNPRTTNARRFYDSFGKDPELTQLLKDIKADKVLFTSANHWHSVGSTEEPGIIRRMQLKSFFRDILTSETYRMDKRNPKMFPIAHKHFGLGDKKYILFHDDQLFNLREAKKLGWVTVLIAETSAVWKSQGFQELPSFVDYAFARIHHALRFFNHWLRHRVVLTSATPPLPSYHPQQQQPTPIPSALTSSKTARQIVHAAPHGLPPRGNFLRAHDMLRALGAIFPDAVSTSRAPNISSPRRFGLHQSKSHLGRKSSVRVPTPAAATTMTSPSSTPPPPPPPSRLPSSPEPPWQYQSPVRPRIILSPLKNKPKTTVVDVVNRTSRRLS